MSFLSFGVACGGDLEQTPFPEFEDDNGRGHDSPSGEPPEVTGFYFYSEVSAAGPPWVVLSEAQCLAQGADSVRVIFGNDDQADNLFKFAMDFDGTNDYWYYNFGEGQASPNPDFIGNYMECVAQNKIGNDSKRYYFRESVAPENQGFEYESNFDGTGHLLSVARCWTLFADSVSVHFSDNNDSYSLTYDLDWNSDSGFWEFTPQAGENVPYTNNPNAYMECIADNQVDRVRTTYFFN